MHHRLTLLLFLLLLLLQLLLFVCLFVCLKISATGMIQRVRAGKELSPCSPGTAQDLSETAYSSKDILWIFIASSLTRSADLGV